MREFHRGPYETAVGHGELLAEVRGADHARSTGSAYEKLERRAGDWAVRRRRAPSSGSRARRLVVAEVGIGLTAVGAAHFTAHRGRGLPARPASPPRRTSPRPGASPPRTATRAPTSAGPSTTSATSPASSPSRALRRAVDPRRTGEGPDMQITVTVNGTPYVRDVEPRLLLTHFLRDELRLTGTHWGCDTSNCGACVVSLDGVPVKSCTVLAVMADGREVRTVEGLAARRRAGPRPAGLRDLPRPAVRVLHPRDDDHCAGAARPASPTRRRPRSARRSPARSAGAPATRTSSAPCGGPPSTRPPRTPRPTDEEVTA